MFEDGRIEDTLDDIKRIIFYYSDSIDYTDYIKELEAVLITLKDAQSNNSDSKRRVVLANLEERAKLYLAKVKTYQLHYENQDNTEMA